VNINVENLVRIFRALNMANAFMTYRGYHFKKTLRTKEIFPVREKKIKPGITGPLQNYKSQKQNAVLKKKIYLQR
jgi:hypothetical protein